MLFIRKTRLPANVLVRALGLVIGNETRGSKLHNIRIQLHKLIA